MVPRCVYEPDQATWRSVNACITHPLSILNISAAASASFKQARLLVFDLDGTLIDSRQDLALAVNATLRKLGQPELSEEIIASYVGDGALALIQRALNKTGLNSSDPEILEQGYQQFLMSYREHKLDHTYVYPGVLDALHAIRSKSPHRLMACLSNKPVGPSRAICDALALAPFFFQIYGGNSFSTKKPDPRGLNHLIVEAAELVFNGSESGEPLIHAGNTVVIGDGYPDVLAARAAGVLVIGCDFGFSRTDLAAVHPDALVTSPSDWVDLLCGS